MFKVFKKEVNFGGKKITREITSKYNIIWVIFYPSNNFEQY